MNDRTLISMSTAVFTGMAQVQRELPDALGVMGDNDRDGYPTSCIGASPETPGPPVVYEGNCRELVQPYVIVGYPPVLRPCASLRPCPDHDTPVDLTSTERAALAQKPNQARREVEIVLRRLAQDTVNLQRLITPYRPKIEPPQLCNCGTGRDGSIVWADPLCRQIADPRCYGMCLDTFARMNAWRIVNGHEPVERSPDPLGERNVTRGPRGRFTAA